MHKHMPIFRPVMAAAFVLAGVVLHGPTAHAVSLPYSEDFNDGTADDFEFFEAGNGDWSIGGGTLNLGASSGTQQVNAASVNVSDDLSSKTIRMSMSFTWSFPINRTPDIGFAAFGETPNFAFTNVYDTDDQHYLADVKSNGSMRILKNDGSAFINIVTSPSEFTFSLDETYELILLIEPLDNGDRKLTLTIDDPLQGLVSISGVDEVDVDGPLLTGDYFGIRTYDRQTASFDDFSIAEVAIVPEPSTGLLVLALLGLGLTCWRRKRG